MKWITRERPKIDRLACPWLIKKFVDKDAEFIYVPFAEAHQYSKGRKADLIIAKEALSQVSDLNDFF